MSGHCGGLRRFGWVVPGLAILLAGCAPALVSPEASLDIPAHYTQTPRGAPPQLEWWRAFHLPELTKFASEALEDSLDIEAAIARIEQADAQARLAGAVLLPTLSGSSSVTNSQSSAFDALVRPQARTNHNIGLTASFELDFWGKNRAAAHAAEATTLASRYDAETVRLATLVSVANTYFQILAARERLRLVNENLTLSSRVLTLIKDRLAAGTATALDSAQQETVVNNLRAQIPPFRQSIAQNADVLALLLGRPPQRLNMPGGTLRAAMVPAVSPGIPSDLLVRRPDIASAQAQLESAHASLEAARAAFFPTISLTAQGGFQSFALNTLLDPKNSFYSLATSLTQPIFDGSRLQSQFDQNKGRQDELVATYRKSVLSGFSDVEKALAAIKYLAQQEALQRLSLASSQRAYELSEQRLKEGTVDLVTVLNTQQSLFSVEDALVQTRLARLQAAVSLYQALGGGWPRVSVPVKASISKPNIR